MQWQCGDFFCCFGGMRSETQIGKNSDGKRVKMWKYLAPPTLFHLHEFMPKINDPIWNWTYTHGGNMTERKKNSKHNWRTNNLQSNGKKNEQRKKRMKKKRSRNEYFVSQWRRWIFDCWLLSNPSSFIAAHLYYLINETIMRHSFSPFDFSVRGN